MADIEEIRRKIDRLISEKGFNYRDVSLKIGRKDSYIQQYVKYGYPRRLKEIDRMRLAKLLDIDDADIMDDEVIASKTFGSPNVKMDIIANVIRATYSDGDFVSIDVLSGLQTDEGDGGIFNNVSGKHIISKSAYEELTASDPKDVKILKISGDSMKPVINSGDTIWVDTSYQYPEADGLYLLASGKEAMIKRIQISPLDGTVEITSDNPNYKAYHAQSYKEVKVLGKLICLMQKL